MATDTPITADYVRSRLDYDPGTGFFRWKYYSQARPQWNAQHAGKVAGSLNFDGYVRIAIDGHRYPAHRLAWLYGHGEWPDEIDHLNGARSDNRLNNLRSGTHVDNMRNQGIRNTNRSGVTGVHWCRVARKWVAQIKVSGKSRYVGQFKDKRLAIAARQRAEKEHGFLERTPI